MRILITGSRVFSELDTIRAALVTASHDHLAAGHHPSTITVVEGDAKGADSLSEIAARELGFTVEKHPAIWRPNGVYNPAAGPERNQRMVDLGADICLAFPQTDEKNIGTNHCIRAARAAGIPVTVNQSRATAAVVALPTDLSFVTIDFETANTDKASIIQVGVSKVIAGEIITTHTRPVMPHMLHRRFAPANTRIHGLRPHYIDGALPWPERLEKIVRFADGLPLIAHNSSVERGCITRASESHDIVAPDIVLLCSLKLARRHLPDFQKHGLAYLAEAFEFTDFSHHDAGEDARITARAVLEIARRTGLTSTAALFAEQVTEGGYTPLNKPTAA
jgi:DNA polymerase-3 subunit epsilon